jgi:hypothetical protein
MMRQAKFLRRLARSRSGVAMTEFALSLPFLLTAGLWGTEEANLAITHMRVSQLAIHIADNASRIGDTSALENRKVFESDINDLLLGSNIQADGLNFYEHGRAIVSSLEVYDPAVHCAASGPCAATAATDGDQFIHWQRCKGVKAVDSTYGLEGAVLADGMGPDGEEVPAQPGIGVNFVEVVYDYQPMIALGFVQNTTIYATASFIVRDSRDLSQVYQRDPSNPDSVASCAVHDGYNVILG